MRRCLIEGRFSSILSKHLLPYIQNKQTIKNLRCRCFLYLIFYVIMQITIHQIGSWLCEDVCRYMIVLSLNSIFSLRHCMILCLLVTWNLTVCNGILFCNPWIKCPEVWMKPSTTYQSCNTCIKCIS